MTISNPVKLGFDPKRASDTVKTIFGDDVCRTLWLAWRAGHIVSQFFDFDCWSAAQRLKARPDPISQRDLEECLVGHDFYWKDVREWAPAALPFFNGLTLEYITPDTPEIPEGTYRMRAEFAESELVAIGLAIPPDFHAGEVVVDRVRKLVESRAEQGRYACEMFDALKREQAAHATLRLAIGAALEKQA